MKRKGKQDGGAKKAKTEGVPNSAVQQLLEGQHGESYCEELGIDLEHGGSKAVYQWLCCCIVFGQRISEKTTIRAAKGLLASGLDDPKSVKEVEFQERVDALNSQGKVQRGERSLLLFGACRLWHVPLYLPGLQVHEQLDHVPLS